MGKVRYIHIGMPKNLSTTLQRDFFSKHPEIMHLGVGVESNVGYINPKISSVCENHFQYSKKFSYNKAKDNIKDVFQTQFNIFEKSELKKACGISLELLSFTFTPDQIEIEEKAKRVFDVFGKDTKIVLIIREQFKLIESLYKEAIKIGYYGTFQEYLEYIYYLRDKNFLYDFNYDYLYQLYCKYFGKENIIILPIENYRNTSGELIYEDSKCKLIYELSKSIGVSYIDIKLGHYNKPLTKKQLETMRELNKKNVHGIGNQFYSTGVNFHRLKDYFQDEIVVDIKEDLLYKDARIKKMNIEESKKTNSDSKEMVFDYPEEIRLFLEEMFKKSNDNFQKLLEFEMPKIYFK